MAFDSTNNRLYRHGGLGYYSNVGVEVDMQDLWCAKPQCCDSIHLRAPTFRRVLDLTTNQWALLYSGKYNTLPLYSAVGSSVSLRLPSILFLTLPNCTACDAGCAHPARRGVSQQQAVGVWRH